MFGLSKSFFVTAVLLGGLSFYPLALPTSFHVDESKDARFQEVPYQIGAWTGKDETLDERTYEILETRNVLSRLYQNPDNQETVHLLLVSSDKDRRVAHPPEVCYTSSNFDIISSKDELFEVTGKQIPVKVFVAQDQNRLDRKQYVLYVYQIGEHFTASYYAQQLKFAVDNLAKKDSKVLLIRLSASSESSFQQFLSEILPHVQAS